MFINTTRRNFSLFLTYDFHYFSFFLFNGKSGKACQDHQAINFDTKFS